MSESHFWRRRWKLIFNIVTVLALVVLVIALHEQIAQTIDNLSRVNAWALLLMIPLEFSITMLSRGCTGRFLPFWATHIV